MESDNGNTICKILAFRYCIFGRRYWLPSPGTWNSGGLAELSGNDFMVTLAAFMANPGSGSIEDYEAGAFMHELGHTLGLRHGGDQEDPSQPGRFNYKPNYFSVMNYSWCFPANWMPSADHRPGAQTWGQYFPDFSDRQLPTLRTSGLSERDGIQGQHNIWIPYGITPGSINCDSRVACTASQQESCVRLARFVGPVDWDNNCAQSPGMVPAVVNAINGTGAQLGDTLLGHNDWANLDYDFKDSANFADNAPAPLPPYSDINHDALAPFLGGETLATYRVFGGGCPGSQGNTITQAQSPPRLGDHFCWTFLHSPMTLRLS
ncbi:MAG: hypothetical protein IPK26_27640 [Planctomycetes bacterium]|nr:hypothetical protein [Planctomycetota bacterium]